MGKQEVEKQRQKMQLGLGQVKHQAAVKRSETECTDGAGLRREAVE